MERVVGHIEKGVGLVDAFERESVPLPSKRVRSLPVTRGPGSVLLLYTDLEPDDLLAVSCELQLSAAAPPVILFTASMKDKDQGGIFAKKLAMSTAALGAEFAEELLVVAGKGLPEPPQPFGSSRGVERAAERALTRAAETGLQLEVLILAPGRGNIEALLAAMKARPEWPTVAKRTRVRMYSGSFNIRGSTEKDIAAISEMAQADGNPLQDIAHFIWTRNDGSPQLRDLPSICPGLSAELEKHNPYFRAAWFIFGLEFNANLVTPTHWRLWAQGQSLETLSDEERKTFDAAKARFDAGDVRGYCKAVAAHESLLAKVAGYKRSTIRHLADGTLDGPLCDCLVFLSAWAQQNMPGLLTLEKAGVWSVDHAKGFTSIAQEGKLCRAVQPALVEGKEMEAARELGSLLQASVLSAVSLYPAATKAPGSALADA